MASYSFPTNLSAEEILQWLEDMNMHLDAAQLQKPTFEAVRACYEQAIIGLLGVSREEIMQANFDALVEFEYPELYDDSIPLANLMWHLGKLLAICGVRDFTPNDVFKPEPARLKRNLCAFINFAKFREEKLQYNEELEAELAAQLAMDAELAAEREKLAAEWERLQIHRSARKAEAAQIELETAGTEAENLKIHKAYTVLQSEANALKSQLNAVSNETSETKLSLSSLRAEIEALDAQIVQSPEKHHRAIADLLASCEQQRAYYAALCSTSHDHNRKLEMMQKFEKELQRIIALEESLESIINRKKGVSSEYKDVLETIKAEDRKYSDLEMSVRTSRRQLASLADKLSRVQQQGERKLETAMAVLEEQKRARDTAEAQRTAAEARATEQEILVRKMREDAAKTTAEKDALVRSILDKYSALRRAVATYNRDLNAAIDAAQAGGNPGLDVDPLKDMNVVRSTAAMEFSLHA